MLDSAASGDLLPSDAERPAAEEATSVSSPVWWRWRDWRRWALAAAAVVVTPLLVFLVLAIAVLNWSGVYPGVRVGETDLSGASRAEAAVQIASAASAWEATPIYLILPQCTYTFTRADLGLRIDQDAALKAALARGRGGSAWQRLVAIVGLYRHGETIALTPQVDAARLRSQLALVQGETDRWPRDGDLRIEHGQIIVTPPVEGRGLDLDASVRGMIAIVAPTGATEVVLPVADHIQPRVNAAVIDAARARAEAYLAAPVTLHGTDLDQTFDPATIAGWLRVQRDDQTPLTVTLDPARVRTALAPLAGRVDREAQNATDQYDVSRQTFVVTAPDVTGRRFDLEQTTAAVIAALQGTGTRQVTPVVQEWPAHLTSADIIALSHQAAITYLAGDLSFTWQNQRWTVPPAQLAQWLTIQPAAPGTDGAQLVFDTDALASYLNGLRSAIDRPAIDAGYTLDVAADGYRVTSPSQVGYSLDAQATARQAQAALAGGQSRILPVSVAETRPKVTEADVAAMHPEHWISIDLTAQRMYAMIGNQAVYTAVISSGKAGWETPTGTFYIQRRVANETMTSESIGAEDYYYLENVLYTQYFTNEGHALHYSWWKAPSSFGVPTSHGCISETLDDATYFWNFATIGTRIVIYGVSPT